MEEAAREAAIKKAEDAISKILFDLEEEIGGEIDDVDVDTRALGQLRCSIFVSDNQ